MPNEPSGATWPSAISAEDNATARGALARILASTACPASERRRRLLRYLVDQALAGRVDRLSAHAIAVATLGRTASFDPQTDPSYVWKSAASVATSTTITGRTDGMTRSGSAFRRGTASRLSSR